MRAQIQRTKLFRSLAVERDSIPLHSTPLDSIRIRIEFRFSSLSLFLSPPLSLSLSFRFSDSLRTPGFSLLAQTRCNYLLLSTRKTPLRSRSRSRFNDISRVLASLVVFHAGGEPQQEEEEGKRKQRARRKGKKEKGRNEKRARDPRHPVCLLTPTSKFRRTASRGAPSRNCVFSRGRGSRALQRAPAESNGKTESYVRLWQPGLPGYR